MMRDQSSVDAAPATLRLEESQPGTLLQGLGACCKLWKGRTMGGNRPSFQAPLIFRSPKHTDSSRFCSHIVHAPANPNPLRSHSMASNPRIVRRAVWKD